MSTRSHADSKNADGVLSVFVGLGLLFVGWFSAVSLVSKPPQTGEIAGQTVLRLFSRLEEPAHLVAVIAGLYLLPRVPPFLRSIGQLVTTRLQKVSVGEVALELSPSARQAPTDLLHAPHDGPSAPARLSAAMLPAVEGELRDGRPPSSSAYDTFESDSKGIFDDISSWRPPSPQQGAEAKAEEQHEAFWLRLLAAEDGWSDEWTHHLERSAQRLAALDVPGGLREGLGRTLLFRRLLLLEASVKFEWDSGRQRACRAALVGDLPRLSNKVRRAFLTRSSFTSLLLLLIHHNDADLLRNIGEDTRRAWVGPGRRPYEDGLAGVREACADADDLLSGQSERLQALLARTITAERVHPSLVALRFLMRARAADALASRAGRAEDPATVAWSRRTLHACEPSKWNTALELRSTAAELLARRWCYGSVGVGSLLAEVPELSESAEALNDLAASIARHTGSPAEHSLAVRLLGVARSVPGLDGDFKAHIDANKKRLDDVVD